MKRIISIALSILLAVSVCFTASATTIYPMDDWNLEKPDNSPWEIDSYLGSEEEVVVPSQFGVISVTILGNHAFANNATAKSVIISEPIDTIGDYVFMSMESLTEVIFCNTVNSIGEGVFAETKVLRSVNLEDTAITELHAYSFLNSGIEEVALPETCVTIKNNAFAQCDNLVKVTIPASVTEIGTDAFRSSEKVVIHAPYGSYAIDYAVAHEIPYEYSDLTEVSFLRGDADGDGTITIMDATKIQRVLVYLDTDNEGMIALRSTLTENGFGVMDATRIQRKLALYDDPYHIGESVTVYLYPDGTIFTPAEQAVEA